MRYAVLILTATALLFTGGDAFAAASPAPLPQPAPGSELRRRALFGAQLAPVPPDVRERLKLEGDGGVLLERVFPGTSAAAAGFKAGDVVLSFGGQALKSVPELLAQVAKSRAGDVLLVAFVRDGARQEARVTLKELPREQGDGFDVIYGAVASHGARRRIITLRPKAAGRHPAVLMLQGGHTCFSIDEPLGEPSGFTRIARELTKRGYVTMRIERPGCGDSEGGPLRDVDFDTEVDGNLEALRALKRLEFVDADKVFLFGHSMGGIVAPLIAERAPVRGIAVFGTTAQTWFESVIGQRRRLAVLDGTDPAELDREILEQTRFWYPLAVELKSPLEFRDAPGAPPRRVFDQWVKEDRYVFDRHYSFYHQVARKNLSETWGKIAAKENGPKVLAIWGVSDWLATKEQATWIAEVVNRVSAGSGTFAAVDALDHFFLQTATPEESFRAWMPPAGTPPAKFNPAIVETLAAWLGKNA